MVAFSSERLVVQAAKHHDSSRPLAQCKRVEEEDAREEDGQELSGGHNCGEQKRSKLFDGEEDEELAGSGCDRQGQDSQERRWVFHDKSDGRKELVSAKECYHGDQRREKVDPEHLVISFHLVTLEQLVLESRRKAVESQITAHQQDSIQRRVGIGVNLLALTTRFFNVFPKRMDRWTPIKQRSVKDPESPHSPWS